MVAPPQDLPFYLFTVSLVMYDKCCTPFKKGRKGETENTHKHTASQPTNQPDTPPGCESDHYTCMLQSTLFDIPNWFCIVYF